MVNTNPSPLPSAVQTPPPDAQAPPATTGGTPPRIFNKGKHSGVPFDPIKENGPIFVNWPKPRLALVFSGRQDGYLEPCGCAGLDRMKGGMSRRDSMFKELREKKGWTALGLDVGGLVKGFGRQAELKFQITVEAMREMGYTAIALGKSDLRFSGTELASVVAGTPGQPSPFLSANVAIFGFDLDPPLVQQYGVVTAAGKKIGVTAVLGKSWQADVNNPDLQLADPVEKLREVMPKLKAQQCDLLILLAHATMPESIQLAKDFPEFNIVVTADSAPLPPEKPQKIGETYLIEVGEKGMHVVVLGFFDDPQQPVRYQSVPLDSRFENSATMRLLMANYQDQLQHEGLEGLGIRAVPLPNPLPELNGRYVGSEKCESCHETSYKIWKKTGHREAWATLKNLDPPRIHDPECISCHVVGWDPANYFPYESGFTSEEKTPHLVGVGCESCHGPGEKHVAAEMGADLKLQEKYRKSSIVTKEEARNSRTRWCINCHDLDNSPDFNFDDYWPQIEHYEGIHGKESPEP